jgi:uncharacterized protein DUF6659
VKGNLCERIVKLDPQIRFVGIVNSKGEVVEGGYQEGVEPLLDGQDEQIMYMHSLSNMALLHDLSDKLGNVKYSLIEHQKVVLMTFPLNSDILCLSISSGADVEKLRTQLWRSYPQQI